MRLLSLPAVIASLATIFQVAGVWAYPSPTSAVLVARDDQHHPHQLESQAPPVPGSITIPLFKEAGHSIPGRDRHSALSGGWLGTRSTRARVHISSHPPWVD
jgi:hypothetical protein